MYISNGFYNCPTIKFYKILTSNITDESIKGLLLKDDIILDR